jgi:2-polyprenyl-6-methoxyphenol hydroxylase-like FAD-dependent oxidoreductase
MHDVVVVGAGFCGSIVGLKADDLGLNVKVIDANASYPDHFRAEKLEDDQWDALATFRLTGMVRPIRSPVIDQVHTFSGDNVSTSYYRNHRGIEYSKTVNAFRDALRDRQLLEIQRTSSIRDGQDFCEVLMSNGSSLRARLVVLATGMAASLRKSLGLFITEQEKLVSTTFGFDIEPLSSVGQSLGAFNFRPRNFISGLHYVTFFPIGDRLRANLFTCWDPGNEQTKQFKANTPREIRRLFPDLDSRIGQFEICSEVQAYTTRHYRFDSGHLRRIALVGDACQSVSPANGVGLSKCLTDAKALLDLLPGLLASRTAHVDLASYYRNERKRHFDREALQRWRWSTESATSQSLKTKIKKLRFGVSAMISKNVTKLRRILVGNA